MRQRNVSKPDSAGQFTGGASATPTLAALNWNQMLFYPEGARAADVVCRASMILPKGWTFATALTTSAEHDGHVSFAPVSLETLVDSPVITGRHLREIDISTGDGPRHYLDMVADDPAAMAPSDDDVRHLRPMFHGDTLYARTEVLAVRDSKSQPDRGIVTVKTEGLNQKDEVVLEFQRAVMLPKRTVPSD